MRVHWILPLLAASGIGACDHLPAEDPRQARPNARYLCEDIEVAANFLGDDRVQLVIGERRLILQHVRAASGAKYADTAGNEFWTRDAAMLTLAGQPARQCLRASPP